MFFIKWGVGAAPKGLQSLLTNCVNILILIGTVCTTSGIPQDNINLKPPSSDKADFGVQLIAGYSIGRLAEGQFEYPRLNGWMTPDQATNLCERDLMCGGYTYKVRDALKNIKTKVIIFLISY